MRQLAQRQLPQNRLKFALQTLTTIDSKDLVCYNLIVSYSDMEVVMTEPLSGPAWAMAHKLDPSKIMPGTVVQICNSIGATLTSGVFVCMEGTVAVYNPHEKDEPFVNVAGALEIRPRSRVEHRHDLGDGPHADFLVDFAAFDAHHQQIRRPRPAIPPFRRYV
jgi:hypothetical protein